MKTLKILLIEDNPGDVRLISEMLKEISFIHFSMTPAATLNEACEHLKNKKYDVILLDLSLPDSSGQETFSSVLCKCRQVPIVIISGLEDIELSFKLIHEGAQDYLCKQDLNAIVLLKAMEYAIERNRIEKSLIEAKERAEELKNVKEEFLANMSHEIRTPMNAIIGYTRLLENTKMSEKQKDWLQAIKLSGENLLVIINDILDLSKIEAGKLELAEEQINIPYCLNLIYKTMKVVADEKNIGFHFSVDETIPTVLMGDEVRLTQALQNLISNAIKFTGHGKVNTDVVLEKETDTDVTIRFTVSDTGVGIPEDKISLIFDSFTQVRDKTVPRNSGTGLGLTITKKIVEMMGGAISVKSKYTEGSSFTVTIRFAKPKEQEKIKTPKSVKEHHVNTENLSMLDVLVAEDNPLNAKFILSLFNEHGINADVAVDGAMALEMLKEKEYDILLLDIEMPKMTGYQVTGVIRNELKSDIPIIALTAHAMSSEKEKCMRSGMDDYISKPIKAELLFEKMSHLAKKKKNHIPTPTAVAENEVTEDDVINLELLNQSFNGKKNLILEIIEVFLKQAVSDIDELNKMVEDEDYPRIKAMSHAMRSSYSMMGAKKVAPLLEEIENISEQGSGIDKIRALNKSLNVKCKQVIEALKAEKVSYQ